MGDRVKIKSLDWYNRYTNGTEVDCGAYPFTSDMKEFCGQERIIANVCQECYFLLGIDDKYAFTDEMIEGLVEEDFIPKFGEYSDNEPLDIPTMTTDFIKEHGFPCPNDYIFKDENGNIINATKIVLEKKKKEVILTQEQIDKMVHESCVLFCKHCGCGVPRETCTSLGSCKGHDEYRKSMRTYFEKHKK